MRPGGDKDAFIAIDWGSSNRRIYRIENGIVTATERDAMGVLAMDPASYPDEVARVRARMGDLPLLVSGMAGSTIGWREAAYAPLPATLASLRSNLTHIDERTAIVPGLVCRDGHRLDVMRGEEVQLLGALASAAVPADALLCQPGTHCKWARARKGTIVDFATAITGDLFAALREQGVLARSLTSPVFDGEAFREGVRRGAGANLAEALFHTRAAVVLNVMPENDAASFASGILIGNDVGARLRDVDADGDGDGVWIWIVSEPPLSDLYAVAVAMLGHEAHLIPSGEAFVTGMVAIARETQ